MKQACLVVMGLAMSVGLTVAPAFAQGEKKVAPAHPQASEKKESDRSAEFFDAGTLKEIASGFKFTEGPLWLPDGRLLFCDMSASVMYTVKPPAKLDDLKEPLKAEEYRKASERAAGTTLDRSGRLLAAHFAGKVTRTKADGSVEVIASECDGKPFGACNDLVTRADGVVYFTDFGGKSGSKGVFKIGTDGKVSLLTATLKAANGVALSPDEKTLYAADYGDKKVYAYDVQPDGSTSGERVFVDFKGDKGPGNPDGMKVDHEGNLYTTGPGGIWVVSSTGEKHGLLKVPGASNFCFGGEDGKTMFITAGSKVFAVRTRHAGIMPAKQIKK